MMGGMGMLQPEGFNDLHPELPLELGGQMFPNPNQLQQ
jgi:hypothetical protein